jgi:hypothetical protein
MGQRIFSNSGTGFLSAQANPADTTLTLVDASTFPTSGEFTVHLNSELIRVTSVSGNTLTVLRGQEGTTAGTHAAGSFLWNTFSRGAIRAVVPYGLTYEPVPSSGWTTVNGAATFSYDASNDTIILKETGPAAAQENVRFLSRSVPATPWTITAAFGRFTIATGNQNVGLMVRESSTGKLIGFGLTMGQNTTLYAWKWTNPTTYSGQSYANRALPWEAARFLRIADDGTNLKFSYSADGENFVQLHSVSRTDYLASGPDHVGPYVNSGTNNGALYAHCLSWKAE